MGVGKALALHAHIGLHLDNVSGGEIVDLRGAQSDGVHMLGVGAGELEGGPFAAAKSKPVRSRTWLSLISAVQAQGFNPAE